MDRSRNRGFSCPHSRRHHTERVGRRADFYIYYYAATEYGANTDSFWQSHNIIIQSTFYREKAEV